MEEVALEKLELVEQPIPRASIRQFVNLIPSRTRSWRVANLVSKTGGGGGGGWGKKEERIFFSIFFFPLPRGNPLQTLERTRGSKCADNAPV